MVTKAELVAVSKKEKIPLGTVEKDFILTFILKKIYESGFSDILVFKGGTALHKLYLHKRFSVDLDFTALKRINENDLRSVIEDREIKSKIKDINDIGNSTRITLGYVSVLEFANRIFLDLSKREQPVLPLVRKKIHSPFFEDFEVLTFQLEELLAEKLRAIMQRKKPRDYLDLFYLLEYGRVDFKKAIKIAEVKLSSFREDLDKEKIFERAEFVQSLWERDLREILTSIPDFDRVLGRIKDFFTTQL